jgi:hypothetical protein
MGYELYMKVGNVHQSDILKNEKGQRWFSEECVIDLSKCGESNVGKLAGDYMTKGKALLYWFEDDKRVTEDSYGGKPTPIPTREVIEALRKDVKVLDHGDNDRPYRRFEWALALLEAIDKRDNGKKKEFCVIFNGH